MPRIVRLDSFGGPEVLLIEEARTQEPQHGEVRLRVEAAGVHRLWQAGVGDFDSRGEDR